MMKAALQSMTDNERFNPRQKQSRVERAAKVDSMDIREIAARVAAIRSSWSDEERAERVDQSRQRWAELMRILERAAA